MRSLSSLSSPSKLIGAALGGALAPAAFLGALLRGGPVLHPSGVVYRADVEPLAVDGPFGELARRFTGVALVRLSGALRSWPQSGRRPDMLGIALRLRGNDRTTTRRLVGDQDLLFVTSRSLLELVVAVWATDVRDFLSNRYYTVLPYSLIGVGRVALRLIPEAPAPAGDDRRERLQAAVQSGEATLRLEVRALPEGAWTPVAAVHLVEPLKVEPGELAFDPGTAAMGLTPVGVIQGARPPVYRASEAGLRVALRLH